MDSILRKALEHKGLSASSSDAEAQEFYSRLSLEEKGRIGVELGMQSYHQPQEPLSIRNGLQGLQQRDITTRSFQLRAQTVNEEDRSVEAVISTDAPVEVWDWRRGETVDEVLLATAAQIPAQMPMLANHDRWSLDSVLGSIRGLRVDGGSIIGRLCFAKDDEDSEKAWNKVRQSHIVDVSVGYRVNEATEIAPGQTANVSGKQYTAGKRALRIVTNWTPKEGSLVPIGADQAAKIREDQTTNYHRKEGSNVNPKLRAFLETLGLRHEANEAEAQTYYDSLPQADKARADAAAKDQPTTPTEPTRNEPTGANPARPDDPAEVARQAVVAERERVRQLTDLAGSDVPAEVRQRAINEGWDVSRASAEFLTAVRASRTGGVGPGIHVHGHDTDCNARSLAAGLLIGQGLDPTNQIYRSGGSMPARSERLTEQDADRGHRYRSMSSFDLMRECVGIDTGKRFYSPEEMFDYLRDRSAPSGGTLSYVFSTNVYARLIQGWETVGDTTTGWCEEEDVPNFLEQEEISLQANARLERLARGDTAKDATAKDSHETYKIARYAKKFVIDEQDIIDDRLGAIMRMPQEMGEAARNLRPDLVYSLLLENPTMGDTGAAFNNTVVTTNGGHANLTTGALASGSLKAAISAMVKQRLNRTSKDPGRALVIRPKFLIVPAALEWTARELTASAALAKLFADSNDPFYSQLNLLSQEGLRVVADDRIGAIGVLDPKTGEARTGLDTNWFLTSGRGLRVAYRRGTGRQPVMRSFTLDRGQWGQGWDINLDIGVAFLEWLTWHKSTGASS